MDLRVVFLRVEVVLAEVLALEFADALRVVEVVLEVLLTLDAFVVVFAADLLR